MRQQTTDSTVHIGAPPCQCAEVLWDVREAAAYLKVSIKTVRRLVVSREIPHTRVGGQLRFVPGVLRNWAAKAA